MTVTRIPGLQSDARDDVRAAIGQAAQATGINFQYLLAQAKSESGLNPNAKAATSSAKGLYQFIDQSWLGVVKQHGANYGLGWAADAITQKPGGGYTVAPALRDAVFALRQQAGPAAMMAAASASDNAQSLSQSLGRAVNGTDLYFAHFLGPAGASKFLRAQCTDGSACAASLFPQEARANRGIFYARDGSPRSLNDIYALMGRKLDSAVDGSGTAVQADQPAPGSLVATLPGAVALPSAQVALADLDGTTDASSGDSDTSDVGQMLTALEQTRVNVLKPTPAQAKLAYLMLSLPTV